MVKREVLRFDAVGDFGGALTSSQMAAALRIDMVR